MRRTRTGRRETTKPVSLSLPPSLHAEAFEGHMQPACYARPIDPQGQPAQDYLMAQSCKLPSVNKPGASASLAPPSLDRLFFLLHFFSSLR
mmetsp:Transcript_8550/g.16777  ORF Transcript_8550/g.16777 Transcript_8550/m.16777 type:complete len:91 (-) Transcript_8550:3199-3471(-)